MEKKIEVIGAGNACPKCSSLMERRKHGKNTKYLKQKVYFSEWDVCHQCHHTQHYEEFKVINDTQLASWIAFNKEIENTFANL